jgi:predicted nucleotidyltransferase
MVMIDLIEDNREAIAALCRQHGVRRLAVFGSAAKGTFDPARSDIDFVVDFFNWGGPGIFHRFFGFIESLEHLLGYRVDMTTEPVTKPWLRDELVRTQVILYESASSQSVA